MVVEDSGWPASRVFSLRGYTSWIHVYKRTRTAILKYCSPRYSAYMYISIHAQIATNERVCVNTYTLYVSIQNKRPPVIQRLHSKLCLYILALAFVNHFICPSPQRILITNKKLCSRTFNRQQRITVLPSLYK